MNIRQLSGIPQMKTWICGVVVILSSTVVETLPASDWMESFDQFQENSAASLPAPWEANAGLALKRNVGFAGSSALQSPGQGWSWGHASRSTGGAPQVGDSLVAKIFLPSGESYRQVRLGWSTGKDPEKSEARAEIHITNSTAHDTEGSLSYWSLSTTDSAGKVVATAQGLAPSNAWYDIRMTWGENGMILADFKHVEMNYWVPLGRLPATDGFRPKFVFVSSSRGGILDDVGLRRQVHSAAQEN